MLQKNKTQKTLAAQNIIKKKGTRKSKHHKLQRLYMVGQYKVNIENIA